MAQFEIALPLTLQNEGGYVFDQIDKGLETYAGISRKSNPDWEGWKVIDRIKIATGPIKYNAIILELEQSVRDFYKLKYWSVNNLDYINNQLIANELFDSGVNMGVQVAAKFLQEALNLLNRNEQDYKDIAVDGFIGSTTILTTNNQKNQTAVLKTLNGLQFKRYVEICERDKTQEKFFYGWLNRT